MANPLLLKCHSCENHLDPKEIICKYCKAINDGDYNFFEILGLDVSFNLNQEELDKQYLILQKEIHPDNYMSKSDKEKEAAFKYSSLANEAYHILKNKRLRGEYMLSLEGILINGERDNIAPSQELLTEIFLKRDHINSTEDMTELLALGKENDKNLQQGFDEASLFFKQNLLNHAALSLIKVRYLEKIKEEINFKTRILQNESNTNH